MGKFITSSATRFIVSILAVGIVTATLAPFHSVISTTTVALALLVAILFAASFFGRNPAIAASIAAMLSFNYFFLAPVRTWSITGAQDFVAWFAFALTAIVAGELSSYARRRALEAENGRREIERLYSELREAFEQASDAEALRRSEQLKSSLLDAVTHDLRTPLTSIKASVTTLLGDRKILGEEGETEFLEIINEETDRLNEFIDGVVALAKVEAKALNFRTQPCSVDEIVRNAKRRAKRRLASHFVETELEAGLPAVLVDGASIGEVLYTLLDNAAKYSPKSTRIRISAFTKNDGAVAVAVDDQGRGIPSLVREKIFEKYYRGTGDVHQTGSGLGLGLAIARGIVESQGGRLELVDAPEDFVTRFVFVMPAAAPAN